MRPLGPNRAAEAKLSRGGRDEAVQASIRSLRLNEVGTRAVEAKRGRGGLDKAVEARVRPLGPNGAVEAKRGH